MDNLDDKIRDALAKEDPQLLKEMGAEPSVFELVMETFRGRLRWLTFLGVFWGVVFMVLAVLSAIQFFQAVETRRILLWAAATMFCLMAVSMMKIWYWMQLNKNALTREIKRLELQVAHLASRVSSK